MGDPFITVCLGLAGGGLGLVTRSPALFFLGPILAIGGYQVLFGNLSAAPPWSRLALQIAAGIVLGSSFSGMSYATLKKIIRPAVLLAALMVGGGLAIGFSISLATGWDLRTCILATTFGGQTEMLLISEGLGVEVEKVLILQFVRNQIALLVIFPLGRAFLLRSRPNRGGGGE